MDPVSFEDQRYSVAPRTRPAREPFSIAGMLTKRGFSPASANIVLIIIALLILGFAVWFYYSNAPKHLTPEQIQALPNPVPTHLPQPNASAR